MKKTKFLFSLLVAIVMMAMSPQKSWATITYNPTDGMGTGAEGYDKAFDGDTGTKWCVANATNPWVEFTVSPGIKVSGYSFTTGNDTKSNSSRNPKNWVLKGKMNAGEEWTEIDSKSNNNTLGAENETKYDFILETPTTVAYRYFRLEFTHATTFQLSEIAINGEEVACSHPNTLTYHEDVDPSCTTDGKSEYWECPDCGALYSTPTASDASKITNASTLTIPATLHNITDFYNHACSKCNNVVVSHSGTSGTCTWKIFNDNQMIIAPTNESRTEGALINTDTEANRPGYNYRQNIRAVRFEKIVKGSESCLNMFQDFVNLTRIDFTGFNTENVTSMFNMFGNCNLLESLDLSGFNTSNVKSCDYMFNLCSSLTSLTIGNFDMSKAGSAPHMFNDCNALKTLTLKSIPFLKSETFNTQFTGAGVTVNYKLELNDNSIVHSGTNYLPAATTTPTATYTREMSNEWGTLVLPFAVTYAADNGNYKLYYLSAASGENLTFTEYTDGAVIAAGTPVAVKAVGSKNSADKYEISLDGSSTIKTTITPTAAVDGFTMKGTYTALEDQTGMYFIAQNKFWLADDPITIAPFRAWFEGNLSAGAKTLNIVVNDEANGIASVINADGMQNGKFIENGHVVIVKNGKKFNLNGQEIK